MVPPPRFALRIVDKYSCTSQISYSSEVFVYVTNLVQFRNIRVRHKSRRVQKYSCTSQVSYSSEIFEYFTNLVEAERHLKNTCGRRPRGGPKGRSTQHTAITLDRDFTNLVQFRSIRARHKSRAVHKYSSTSQISLRRSVI